MKKKIRIEIIKLISNTTTKEIIKNVCGEKLGFGSYRTTYELKDFPEYVIKFERDMSRAAFVNATEWRNYIDNEHCKKLGKWLAPCHLINEYGNILVQSRVEHREKKEYPRMIPNLFIDTKYQNFGWIGDQFVCCDYPFLNLMRFKLKKARWWSPPKIK